MIADTLDSIVDSVSYSLGICHRDHRQPKWCKRAPRLHHSTQLQGCRDRRLVDLHFPATFLLIYAEISRLFWAILNEVDATAGNDANIDQAFNPDHSAFSGEKPVIHRDPQQGNHGQHDIIYGHYRY